MSLQYQPDLNDIRKNYIADGGNFWIALDDNDTIIGSIGLQKRENHCGILKKFFVASKHRGTQVGLAGSLFELLLEHTKSKGIKTLILDTLLIATRSHKFYKKSGFIEVQKLDLPIEYLYADRNSLLFLKRLIY